MKGVSSNTMPQGNEIYEKMEEDLTCPVCLELYADPLMMTCSHSICKTCLNDIKTSREKLGKTEFDCPTCRNTHQIIPDLLEKLPKNLALENIVIRFQELKSTSLIRSDNLFDQTVMHDSKSNEDNSSDDVFDEAMDNRCGMCDENQDKRADWFCPQCDVLYCQNCLNLFHPRKGSLGRHKVCKPMQRNVIKENVFYCAEHSDEKASIFCDTCKTVACHLCVCQGQGSHGNHLILDLNTAKENIQTSFFKASEDLTVLISAFSLRDKEVDSQMEAIKSIHGSAQTQIASQFQCFVSDITATLTLAKQICQDTISANASQQSQPVQARSKQIKSALDRCLSLMTRCTRFTSLGGGMDKQSLKMLHHPNRDIAHSRAKSLPQSSPLQAANSSISSSDESPNSSIEHHHGAKIGRRTLSLLDQKEASQLSLQELSRQSLPQRRDKEDTSVSSTSPPDNNLVDSTRKKKKRMEDRSLTSTPIPQSERKFNRSVPTKYKSVSSMIYGVTDGASSDKIMLAKNTYKQEKDTQGSEKNEDVEKIKFELGVSQYSLQEKVLKRTQLEKVFHTEEFDPSQLLLMQAPEIEKILDEIADLTKGVDITIGQEEDLLTEVTRNLSTCVSSFTEMAIKLLSSLSQDTDLDSSEVPIMMPSVRSVASPVSPGQKGMPRVQSRTLITWGFSSTSFTAEPVEFKGQWSVNITRNTSHIGDVKTGYLFGVGVAKKSLTSKEQVGMNPYSYGIVCVNASLGFCYDSQVTPITSLTDLPITIRLAVTSRFLGIVLSYWLLLPGSAGTIQGRRVITLNERTQQQDCHTDNDGGCGTFATGADSLTCKDDANSIPMLPVFTVSQRVKMQFPVSSEES